MARTGWMGQILLLTLALPPAQLCQRPAHRAGRGMVYFSDSTAIAPRLNRDGFYDTLEAYALTQLQVQSAAQPRDILPSCPPAAKTDRMAGWSLEQEGPVSSHPANR